MAKRILMVCLGNICRSPLAEGILQSKVDPEKIVVDSAGTGSYHIGNRPDERSIAVGRKYGIDISHQRCRQFSSKDFDNFDIIYTMDQSNYRNVISLARNKEQTQKVKMLLEEMESGIREVPDPYYGPGDGFEKVFHLIDRACSEIAKKL
ncbi:low molecular weight protein-tyrosine-phosphatase [Ulvibacterium marinum]|uniref:low molecular weight protein-tyrosine-phosphatase n=1 Tax=Ulvibacterium marinum TaxID=2419782 RepID=UPI00249530AE|nr:low molecular weight protein-tyrosine-phosphatase [Ulvibacterium marinum]